MRRCFRQYKWLLLLQVLLLFTVSSSLLIARRQQLPAPLELLHLSDCPFPCWIGIIPGKTTISEALALIQNTYPSSAYDFASIYMNVDQLRWYIVTRRSDHEYMSVSFNWSEDASTLTDNTIVNQITILPNPKAKLTLGNWHNLLGQPQGMSITIERCLNPDPNVLYYTKGLRLTLFNNLDVIFNQADKYAIDSIDIPVVRLDLFRAMEEVIPPASTVPWTGIRKSNGYKLAAQMRAS